MSNIPEKIKEHRHPGLQGSQRDDSMKEEDNKMPRRDRTGPEGRGPMSGRGFGSCAGYPRPGYERGRGMGRERGSGRGRGFGRVRGPARGWRWRRFIDVYAHPEPFYEEIPIHREYPPVPETPEEEKNYLEGFLADLTEEVKAVKERLKALDEKKK